MAIVRDLSGNGSPAENKFSSVNRIAATVIANLVPAYIGEKATDVASDQNYVAKRADGDMNADALTNADWAVDNR
tara:strand:- start:1247 stop:1471 length:225 start_codon:yes stop_codon:yes gene_type:complete